MEKLKIAIVTGSFPSISETFIVNQIMFLKQAGHDVHIFCFKKTKEPLHFPNFKCPIYRLRWRTFMPHARFLRLKKMISILYRCLQKNLFLKFIITFLFTKGKIFNSFAFFKLYYQHYFRLEGYDVLHIHFATNAIRVLPQIKKFTKKIVITFHGFDAHKRNTNFYKPLINIPNISYTVNTSYTKNKVLNMGFNEANIVILPVGLDVNFFKPKRNYHVGFNILFIGRLTEFKAPLLAIKIIEQSLKASYKTIHLHLVGDGEQYQVCEEYVKTHDLENFVTLYRSKTQTEIKSIMNISDVFLFPGIKDLNGRCENQGLVVQEAQAMQLPVIVSDVGGIKEGMVHNLTGYVVKENDIGGFVDRLLYLKANPDIKQSLGLAGRDFVTKNYDSTVLGQQLVTIYSN